MAAFAALDVSKKSTSIHIVDEKGLCLWRGKTLTNPAALGEGLSPFSDDLTPVGLETGRRMPRFRSRSTRPMPMTPRGWHICFGPGFSGRCGSKAGRTCKSALCCGRDRQCCAACLIWPMRYAGHCAPSGFHCQRAQAMEAQRPLNAELSVAWPPVQILP